VSSASSADTVAAFAVEKESLIRVSLGEIADEIREKNLFESERTTISELGNIKLTNNMLEGW
jgi:hypothetical protein